MRVFRQDLSALGDIERTPQGGIKAPAFLTRTGVFEYTDTDGKTIREYRSPDEVFKADSMALLKGAPVSVGHPPVAIGPSNFRTYSVGHVGEDVRQEKEYVGATVYLQDDSAITAVNAGMRQVSCGYHCDVDEKPGVAPDGAPYDRVQRNIQYNHLAVVAKGRAGADVRLRLDAAGNQSEGDKMEKFELIDGVEYGVGSDAHRAARERRDAATALQAKTLVELKAAADAAKARADAADAELTKVREGVKSTYAPEKIDEMVATRARVVAKAQALLGKEFKADGRSNEDIQRATIAKAYPALKLDGQSEDYVRGLWHAIPDQATRADASPAAQGQVVAPFPGAQGGQSPSVPKTLSQARTDAIQEQDQRWQRPLSVSKRDRFKELSNAPALQSAQIETQR